MLTLQVQGLIRPRSRSFVDWVARHGPFDYVLDGANIGFYGKSIQLDRVHKARRGGVGRNAPGRLPGTHQVFAFDQASSRL